MASNPLPQAPQSTPDSRSPLATLRRELLVFGISLVCGLIVIPLLIWVVGNRILGTYVHTQDPTAGTGPMRLLADFFTGLTHGSIIFWCVAAGPYILLTIVRALYTYLRSPPATSASRG
jgi:multisubunit Na+/H+ antiporter MnhB subunit